MRENLFKERLRDLRIEKGLSQEALAKALKTYQANIAEWEKGKKKPSMDSIISLAEYFEVSTDYLLGFEREDGTKTFL